MEKTIGNYTAQSNNDFPLDCETLQYIQENRAIAEIIGNIAGDKVMLHGCVLNSAKTERSEGYVFLRTKDYPAGEVLRFTGGSVQNGMFLKKTAVPVNANGNDYPQAYTQRTLEPGIGEERYSWDDFAELSGKTNRKLSEQIAALQKQIETLQPAPVGSIVIWPSNDVPENYRLCDGSSMSKIANPALFDVIGYTYSNNKYGDTYYLPDMKGCFVAGKGANDYDALGDSKGRNAVTLEAKHIPPHKHNISRTSRDDGGGHNSGNYIMGRSDKKDGAVCYTDTDNASLPSTGVASVDIRPPFIVMNYIIKIK